MEESEQQHYADFYSGSRRRRTCWDPPSRTSGCRVGEIRAPPLPEPPPQPVTEPELFYGPTHSGTSDIPASKHTTSPSFGPRGFLHADSDVPSRFPPSSYTGQQREQPTFPSPHTPAPPQLVLDQKPPLQHVLDQQPLPPPPLHMDQQRSPSSGHPTSLRSATGLVSCEEKQLGVEAAVEEQEQQVPAVQLAMWGRLDQEMEHQSVKMSDDVDLNLEREGDSSSSSEPQHHCCELLSTHDGDEDDVNGVDVSSQQHNLIQPMTMELEIGEIGCLPTISEDSVTPKMIEKLRLHKIDHTITFKDVMDGIQRFYKSYTKEMRKQDILNYRASHAAICFLQLKETKPFTAGKTKADSVLPRVLAGKGRRDLEVVYVVVFDPGGVTSPQLLRSTLRCCVVSTLRTRWILTVGELIRASFFIVCLDLF